MTSPQHRCTPSPDPRHPGYCACGQRLPGARDHRAENEFLAQAIDLAEKIASVRWNGYARQVLHRLAVGAERYGDDAFMDRDNLRELAEETPDLGAYAVLELQRLRAATDMDEDDYQQDRLDLLAIAALGAAADHHVQRIRRRRAGLE